MPYFFISIFPTTSRFHSNYKFRFLSLCQSLFTFSFSSLKLSLIFGSIQKFLTHFELILEGKTDRVCRSVGDYTIVGYWQQMVGIYSKRVNAQFRGVYTLSRISIINGSYANYVYSRVIVIFNRYAYIRKTKKHQKSKFVGYLSHLVYCALYLSLLICFLSIPKSVYSQTPDPEPSLVVAPIQGPINTEFQEFGPTMSPDAKTLYFYSKRSNKGYTEIFKSERKKDGTWDFPEEVGELNSPYDDQSPFLSRDGKSLLLSSNRDGSVEVMLPDGKVGISRDLYVSNWKGTSWGKPVALPNPINTEEIEENPHLLGDTLLFTRYPFGKPNLAKVYFSQFQNNTWSTPKLLPSPINDNYATIAAAFNDDAKILFFSSNRPGGNGGFDLYMAKIDGENFTDIENLGAPINSTEDEAYIVFQQVKKTFLFCRRVEGRSFDIFTASVPKQDNIVQKKLEESNKISLDSIYFERASSVLKPESSGSLDAIVDFLHENSEKKMKIIGHTDLTGTLEDNMVLSKERAESVKQYLVSKGVDSKRLSTDGKGPTQPMVQGTDEASSKKNRRTEFVLINP